MTGSRFGLRRLQQPLLVCAALLAAAAAAIGQPWPSPEGGIAPARAAAQAETVTLEEGAQSITWSLGPAQAADVFGSVTIAWLFKETEQEWLSFIPQIGRTNFRIQTGDLLWVVSPFAQTIGGGSPPSSVAQRIEALGSSCDFKQSVPTVFASVFEVVTDHWRGSAFYIGNDEFLTSAHVVADATSIRLRAEGRDFAATIVGLDSEIDVALLRASGAGLAPLTFADLTHLGPGHRLALAGYPVRVTGSPSVTSGLLSKIFEREEITFVQTDAATNPGNSGGPVFTECGAVAAMVVSKLVGEAIEGIAFAVAAPSIVALLAQLRAESLDALPDAGTPQITAFCNGDWDTATDCRAAAASGLDPTAPWQIWADGGEDLDNLIYSLDGEAARESNFSLSGLAPGEHAIRINERLEEGWSGWSAPYPFTIRDAPLVIAAFCSGDWDKPEDCRAAEADGLDPKAPWQIWVSGAEELANLIYRFDAGVPVLRDDVSLSSLAPGEHTVQVSERRAEGWSGWSAPHAFTVRATP